MSVRRAGAAATAGPFWGVGVDFPQDLESQEGSGELLRRLGNIELIVECLFNGRRRAFKDSVARAGTPVFGHTVELSIGAAEPLRERHLEDVLRVLSEVNTVLYSDHLCMTSVSGIDIGQLTTLPWTHEQVDVLCRKIDQVQRRIPWPFLLENITNRFIVPGNELSEPDFINAVMRRTGCGLLLDVTNLYTNSVNFGFDPYPWVDQIDSEVIRGIHLAGGEYEDGVLYDTHSRPVFDEVWELYRYVLHRASPQIILIEWDQDTPTPARLLEEVEKAEAIHAAARGTTCQNTTHAAPARAMAGGAP